MSRAADSAPKCSRCRGWCIELDRPTLAICGQCGGTGKPAKQQELIDG